MTNAELARRVGTSRDVPGRWMADERPVSYKHARLIARALHLPLPAVLVGLGLADEDEVGRVADPAQMTEGDLEQRVRTAQRTIDESVTELAKRSRSFRQSGGFQGNVHPLRPIATDQDDSSTNVTRSRRAAYNPPQRMRADLDEQ
jgi:transcriptional regulator with XRE-family HTH domain